jgi:malate dehydrogenase (oxaloacetate-decarboxylating)(NADP+)
LSPRYCAIIGVGWDAALVLTLEAIGEAIVIRVRARNRLLLAGFGMTVLQLGKTGGETQMSEGSNVRFSDQEALDFHSMGRPGKIEIIASKPMATQRDLSLAYSPGVAVPVRAIAADPSKAYDYTAKGNLVAVISNGTAILGLGNLGALASKPVMEGKAVLFKRFADVDSIDIELNTEDPDAFINAVALMEPSFGGINLEDIKAPECFIIEQTLRDRMNIPIMHDDQHGTAIISAAGLINACYLTGRELKDVRVVVNGAGAAAIACTALIKAMGVRHDNVLMCDRKGVIYQGREGLDQWKSAHAANTDRRTLEEALKGADIFLGLSAAGALKPEMVKDMAPKPIIFAMANPDPEITPPDAKAARPDAIVATGRSDYPNQVNNVLGFPFIFRGALDVRATTINEEMKIAAAQALAELARQQVPEEVAAAYGGKAHTFGSDYIIPAPFDPRLMEIVPAAVAQAAMDSGVAQRPIEDMEAYRTSLRARLNPTTSVLTLAYQAAQANPKRVLFAEGEEDTVLRAAITFREGGYGIPCWSAATTCTTGSVRWRAECRGIRGAQQPHLRAGAGDGGLPLCPDAAPRLPPPRDRAAGEPGPQHLRVPAPGDGRGGRDDHRRHSAIRPDDARDPPCHRTAAGDDAVRDPCAGRPEPHRVHGRHDRHRATQCRAARRHRHPHRRGGAPDGA